MSRLLLLPDLSLCPERRLRYFFGSALVDQQEPRDCGVVREDRP